MTWLLNLVPLSHRVSDSVTDMLAKHGCLGHLQAKHKSTHAYR